MTPRQLKEVVEKNRKRLDINSRIDLIDMIWLVEDLLKKEIEYLEEHEPHAITIISETKIAAKVLSDLYSNVDGMETSDLVKEHIWN